MRAVALSMFALIVMVAVLLAVIQPLQRYADVKLLITTPQRFVVQSGWSMQQAAQALAAQGVIRYPWVLSRYARWTGLQGIKRGEYQLTQGMSHEQLLQMLQQGRVIQYAIRFIEGWTLAQYAQAIQQHPKIDLQLDYTDLHSLPAQLGLELAHAEGWFYPDTYHFASGVSDRQIWLLAYQRMQQQLHTAWQAPRSNTQLTTPYDALILASIIEKETGQPSERAQIAGVLSRRLQQRMRLQTDPTVIYGLGAAFDGNLTRAHLRQPTPYNTYVIFGLPPTPIAMPGIDSIRAALNPAPGDSLYFVAKGDGFHYFSSTLAQHNRAVQRYQRHRQRPASGHGAVPQASQ